MQLEDCCGIRDVSRWGHILIFLPPILKKYPKKKVENVQIGSVEFLETKLLVWVINFEIQVGEQRSGTVS